MSLGRILLAAIGVINLAGCRSGYRMGEPIERPQPVPQNAHALERLAAAATSGQLGCGKAKVTIFTEAGQVETSASLDPIHVFGDQIALSNVLGLLQARAESNRSGRGPMAGARRDICFVCLYTVSVAKAPEALDVAGALLEDPLPEVRDWAAIALLSIGTANPQSRPLVRQLLKRNRVNPSSLSGYGVGTPAWLDDDA